jgi:hypothetical protein
LGIAIGTFGEVFEPNTGFWGFLSEPSYNPSFFYYNVFMVNGFCLIAIDFIRHVWTNVFFAKQR